MHDCPGVTDELARELASHRGRHELGRLELLRHELRLRLCTGARGVEALEGEEDDKAEQNREASREHTEHAGGTVAVLEVTALGGASPDEQHGADRDQRDAATMSAAHARVMVSSRS